MIYCSIDKGVNNDYGLHFSNLLFISDDCQTDFGGQIIKFTSPENFTIATTKN